MSDPRTLLRQARLYLVLDSTVADYQTLFSVMRRAVHAGVKIVQLRSKEGAGRDILEFAQRAVKVLKNKALFIVNDRVDIAIASGAHGVHLGQEDLPVSVARQMLGHRKLIGISCQTQTMARQAQAQGADYLGFGSVFKTQTKPQRQGLDLRVVQRVSANIQIPVFFIGGIDLENVSEVLRHGAERVAVTRAICQARDVAQTTRDFLGAVA